DQYKTVLLNRNPVPFATNWPVRFENGVCACSRASCLSVACRLAGPFNISEKLNEQFRWFIDQLHSDKHKIVNKPDIYLRPKNYKRKPTSSRISNKKLEWRTKQMDQWKLNSAGFDEQATAFQDQEIDGKSLLLMTRNDVLTGLSIKLGPALKIYEYHVKPLQTQHLKSNANAPLHAPQRVTR
uniref:SAM domain-containing protein n=1 Tax=Oncorhynchus tshawytscha TaxID=74940 RepID=A0AAZ3PUV0_ONCTS